MKIEAVVTKPNFFKKNYKSLTKALIISFFTIFTAIILSTILFNFKSDLISDKLMELFVNFKTDFSSKTFIEIFCGFVLTSVPFYVFVIIFGTSSIGLLPIVLTVFIHTFGIGCLASYIFSTYSLMGFEYFLLVLFPGKVITIFSILLLSETALNSSQQIKEATKMVSGEAFSQKIYGMRCFVIGILFLFAALVDTITIKLFSPLFQIS